MNQKGEPEGPAQLHGLTQSEVRQKIKRGEVNSPPERTSRTAGAIIRGNVLTLFNAILGGLLVLILVFGHIRDALFGLVLVANMLIGIVQELRAKFTLDRLSVLTAPKARVIRDGKPCEIAVGEVVLGDVVESRRGDQVVGDGVVLASDGLEVDESLLTGEAVPVDKNPGDQVLSGSFVVAGTGAYRATGVGPESYARKLASEARRFRLVSSELRDGINRILAGVTWIMIPVGLLLFARELSLSNFGDSVSGSVAAMVGMVPEGLVLLASVAFAVAVIVLGRREVLVQELPAVEGLARVDVISFDKTGTLTEAGLEFGGIERLGSIGEEEVAAALAALSSEVSSRNATLDAIATRYPPSEDVLVAGRVRFSSERKWSAVSFGQGGSGGGGSRQGGGGQGEAWVLGAPEILLAHAPPNPPLRRRVEALAGSGQRVLLLTRQVGAVKDETLPDGLAPAALVLLEEKIRRDAAATTAYFAEQGLAIKIISGDDPRTVAAVATRVGIATVGEPVAGSSLPTDPDGLARVTEEHTVFGRVTPRQKQMMVKALQAKGHVVAMTGDGVNDVLAMKDADIGIAVGSGASAATKAVAQLVLLDGRFATLPEVVGEGRRVIGDVERVAYLFVTKTAYATLLALAIGILGWPFPFLPRHFTLIGAFTIGAPAFFLALAPCSDRYRRGFVRRVLSFTIPAGAILAAATLTSYALSRHLGADLAESRTVATLALTVMGLWVLAILARPLTPWRVGLIAAMVAALVVTMTLPVVREFFALRFPAPNVALESLAVAGLAIGVLQALVPRPQG